MGRKTSGERARSTQQVDPPYLDVPTARESIYGPPIIFGQLRDQVDPAPFEFHAGHNGWVVAGYTLAKQVLADRRFSARPELAHGHGAAQLRGFHGPGLFHLSDPPEHTRLRGTVTSEFTPARMQAWESTVRAVADDCIDTLLRDNPDGTADLVAGFAVPFPALVMAEVLGLPPGTRDLFLHGARRAVTGGSGENRSHALATLTGFLKENPAGARDLLLMQLEKSSRAATPAMTAQNHLP
jgi:cytochrome P450